MRQAVRYRASIKKLRFPSPVSGRVFYRFSEWRGADWARVWEVARLLRESEKCSKSQKTRKESDLMKVSSVPSSLQCKSRRGESISYASMTRRSELRVSTGSTTSRLKSDSDRNRTGERQLEGLTANTNIAPSHVQISVHVRNRTYIWAINSRLPVPTQDPPELTEYVS